MPEQENLETVQKIYAAFGEGDVETILGELADDVDWAADAVAGSGGPPWYGKREGPQQVGEFFQALGSAVEVTKFDIIDVAANDDSAMAFVRFEATVKASGESVAMNIHHYWHFTDGKIDRYRGSEDTAQTVAAFEA
jgi:ketosteroid isomerase-like protein